jgi:hypothetical protein
MSGIEAKRRQAKIGGTHQKIPGRTARAGFDRLF